jgi:serine/threonine-protein phosphatase 2A regulatory subunit A
MLSEAVGSPMLERQLLPYLLRLSKDGVPNVRFNVAKALGRLVPKVERATIVSMIRPCLDVLVRDTDQDVRYYANKALALSA